MKRVLGIVAFCALLLTGCSSDAEKLLFESFEEKLVNEDYEGLYLLLSSESQQAITKEDFITRYTNIYSGIKASNIDLEMGEIDTENKVIPFSLTMNTVAGEVNRSDFELPFIKEDKELKVIWSESLIFPMMESGDKVRVSTQTANRGSILDRNGEALASDGTLVTVGIHPAIFDEENRDNKIKELANILDISEETITKKLAANSNPDYFVPIVDLLPDSPKLTLLENRRKESKVESIKMMKHSGDY